MPSSIMLAPMSPLTISLEPMARTSPEFKWLWEEYIRLDDHRRVEERGEKS